MRSIPGWSDDDAALWHTCSITRSLLTGQTDRIPTVGVTFAPVWGAHGERIWTSGPFVLATWEAPGDGSYQHHGGMFFASGGGGLALTGAVLGARAIGNARRRAAARADAVPRWLPSDQGALHVGSHGFYLQTLTGFYPWGWDQVSAASVPARGQVVVQGADNAGRPICWLISAQWAELLFTCWAWQRHRQHPQFVDASWLPAGWWQHAGEQGYPPIDPRPLPELTG